MGKKIARHFCFNDVKREILKTMVGKQIEIRYANVDLTWLDEQWKKNRQYHCCGELLPFEHDDQLYCKIKRKARGNIKELSLFGILSINELTD